MQSAIMRTWLSMETETASPMRRGGRVVECGGLENRFARNPGNEGSNPSSSASLIWVPFNQIKQKACISPCFFLL